MAVAHTVVFLSGVYLVALGLLAITRPSKARGFLQAFVASASTHYFELAVRLAVGLAFVMRAPYMMLSEVFTLFGWALVVTSAGLFLLPWRWHQRFARHMVPRATRHLGLMAVGSLAGGAIVLIAAIRGKTG